MEYIERNAAIRAVTLFMLDFSTTSKRAFHFEYISNTGEALLDHLISSRASSDTINCTCISKLPIFAMSFHLSEFHPLVKTTV